MFSSMRHSSSAAIITGISLSLGAMLAGCASYVTPGAAASFAEMGITPAAAAARDAQTDVSIARRLERKPLASFPASIAIVRVQGRNYHSYRTHGWGYGRFSIVTTGDVETDQAMQTLAALPMVDEIGPLNRLVMPDQVNTEEDLRKAAASVHADMLLLYTFDTQFETDKKVQPLGLISLGLFPDRVARVNSTASAALLDTRNGYVYALAEGTGRQEKVSNAWNNEESLDEARRKAEQQAFDDLVSAFSTSWTRVLARYGPGSANHHAAELGQGGQPVQPMQATKGRDGQVVIEPGDTWQRKP